MTNTRRFYVPTGRHVVLPLDLLPGPNATNLRLQPGETVELELARIARNERYVNGRLRAGDLVELADGAKAPAITAEAPAPRPAANPKNPPAVTITPKE